MKKNYLKLLAIILCFVSIITVFAACKKEDENTLLYKEKSKIFYRKEAGDDAYELVTDANGVTVIDEQGNMLWKVTDANGVEGTHPVSFPAFLEDGKRISCQQFTIECPKGWESTGNLNFILKNVKEGLTISYSIVEPDNKNYLTSDENIKHITDAFQSKVDDGTAIVSTVKTQVAGRDAKKLTVEVTEEGNQSYMEAYYIDLEAGTMTFFCSCNDYNDKDFNFKAILDTIEYRI